MANATLSEVAKRLRRKPVGAVLFAGQAGAGRTAAAATLASELGLSLLRANLAEIASKYIGETEKNLDRLFGRAAESGSALFFDEADALFGKRSRVRDAHDRYANVDTAYLLQQIEAFEGLVILATNATTTLSAPFLARMDYVVRIKPGSA